MDEFTTQNAEWHADYGEGAGDQLRRQMEMDLWREEYGFFSRANSAPVDTDFSCEGIKRGLRGIATAVVCLVAFVLLTKLLGFLFL